MIPVSMMETKRNNTLRRRLSFISVLICLGAAALIGRLFQIQIVLHSHYDKLAEKQYVRQQELKLPRGKIFDRRSEILALDIPRSQSFGVYPDEVDDKTGLARSLANLSGRPSHYFLHKMNSSAGFVYLLRQIDETRAQKYCNIPGLLQKSEPRRFYPFGRNTPKVVGFTDPDGNGIAGIEKLHDSDFASVPGWENVLLDAMGRKLPGHWLKRVEPIPGADIVLTFDNVIQELTATELRNGVEKWGAKGGMAIVMLPRTGELLSVVSLPDFDPNYPGECGKLPRRERSVVDMFEPGSTLKLVPAVASLREGIPTSKVFDCMNGKLRVGSHIIKDVKPHKWLTFEDVIAKSSNIGVAQVSNCIGAEKLYETARDLGLGTYTDVEFPGEAKGQLHPPAQWDEYMLATVGIGQGVSVTAIQLACAYAAVANDGLMLRPMVVKQIHKPGGYVEKARPQPVRRAVTRQIARQMTKILIKAVENGTGYNARIPGLKIAGKTGTAQIPISKDEGYSADRYIASFVGFTVSEPRVLCLVVVEEPKEGIYGNSVAAPIFRRIMEQAAPIVAAEQNEFPGPYRGLVIKGRGKYAPNLISYSVNEAETLLRKSKIPYQLLGEGGKITAQLPYPEECITTKDTLIMLAERPGEKLKLKGLNAREASKILIAAGYKVTLLGSGIVRSADFSGRNCTVRCEKSHSDRG